MFRKGGNVGTGIMTGIVDRSMHKDNPIVSSEPVDYEQRFMEKVVGAGGLPQGMDPLTSSFKVTDSTVLPKFLK